MVHDHERDDAGQRIAKPRYHAEDRIKSEPKPRAGNGEAVIHHAREPLNLREALFVSHAGGKAAQILERALARNLHARRVNLNAAGHRSLATSYVGGLHMVTVGCASSVEGQRPGWGRRSLIRSERIRALTLFSLLCVCASPDCVCPLPFPRPTIVS